ncbi:MAG: thiamine pyrophosphate-dependent dehydrogenase E1 component subunit alpha [Acidobacteriaceae bacterium]
MIASHLADKVEPGADRCVGAAAGEDIWPLYRQMYQIRCVEESFLKLYDRGLLFGTVHTCIGQEVCAVAVTSALDAQRDVVWASHRGHGHYLAFTGDLNGLVAELLGKSTGVCAGIGGSQHLHRGNFYSNGILGGTVACAVGCAFAEKMKGNDGVVAVFFGDGALGEGIIYESLNVASLWQLPVLFVLEDNGIAQSTPKRFEHAGDLATRARSFEIETTRMRADDVLAVQEACSSIVDLMRRSSRPHFLVLETTRLAPHSKGDDTRDPLEIAELKRRDPLRRHRELLHASDPERLETLEAEITQQLESCIAAAMEASGLDPENYLARADAR